MFRIKVEGENLYLSTDRNTGVDVCWTTFTNSDLWKFVSPFDIIPEIKNNTLRLFLNAVQPVLGLSNDGIDNIFVLGKFGFPIGRLDLGLVTITANCNIETNFVSDEGYGAYIKIDHKDHNNSSIGYENYLFGLEATLEKFNDVNNAEGLIEKIYDLGVLFKGGNVAFKTSINDILHGEFDIICNKDLMPDHLKAHLEVAITIHINVDFDINSPIKFNPQNSEICPEYLLMLIGLLVIAAVLAGGGIPITEVLGALITALPVNNLLRFA